MFLLQVDIPGRADDTNIQHEMGNDIQELPRSMHTSSNTFQVMQ
jgi:predicted membrane protein